MNIDFNTDDLKKLTEHQKHLLQNLVGKIEGWREANGINPDYKSYKLSNEEAAKFTKWLQKTITTESSFIPEKGNMLILYSGNTSTGNQLWRELVEGDFLKNNPNFYCISNTDPGAILWKEPYVTAVSNALGSSELTYQVLYGKKFNDATGKYERVGKYAVDGTDLLAMDDFVSYTLTKTAIDNGYSVFYVAGKGVSAAEKKVGILTELPCVISENWIGKIVDEAMANKFVAVDDLNKLLSSDLNEYSDVFIRNSNLLLDDKGIIRGVHLEMNDFPTIDIGKTSGYVSSVNYGSQLGILTDSELFSKYSFLNDSVSQSILDEFRVGEYKLKTTGVDTLTNANLYFDNNGKLVSVRNSVSNSVFETTIGDMRQFRPDAEMAKLFPDIDYDSLTELEKLQLRQFDLEFRKTKNNRKMVLCNITKNK